MDMDELKKQIQELKIENEELKKRLEELEETVSIIKEDLYIDMEFDLEDENGCAGCTGHCSSCKDEEN